MRYYLTIGYSVRYLLHRHSSKSGIVCFYNSECNKWIRYPNRWNHMKDCMKYYVSTENPCEIKSLTKKQLNNYIIEQELSK